MHSDSSYEQEDEEVGSSQEVEEEEDIADNESNKSKGSSIIEEEKSAEGSPIWDVKSIKRRISELEEEEIGQFDTDNKGLLEMSEKLEEIRNKNNLYDHVAIGNDVMLLMKEPYVAKVVLKLQK